MHDIKDNAGIHWNKFKLVDVFDVYNTKSILKEQIIPDSGSVPYVTAGESNNAVMTYINCPNEWIDKGGCVLIGGKTMVVTYQKDDFCSNDSHNLALYLKDKTVVLNEEIFLFLVTVIKKALGKKYVWGDSISRKNIQKDVILLPVDSTGKIAWEYMKEYTANLEQERIAELEAYLIATELDDYELTEEDKQALVAMSTGGGNSDPYGSNESVIGLRWKEFHLGKLFVADKGDVDLQQKDINGKGHYFINSGVDNLGIKGRTDRPAKVFPANSITIDFWGYAYYRDFEYKLATHNHVFSLTGDIIKNREIGLFLVSRMKAFPKAFSYNNMATWNKLKEMTITIPVKEDDTPDLDYMERYIRATEKLIIADAVKWKDKVIETT